MLTDGTPEVRVEWALICDYALVDTGGKLSLLGIFDRLFAANFPAVHPVLFIAAQWVGSPNLGIDVELRIWGPSKELIGSAQQHVQLTEKGQGAGILRLAPLPLPTTGEYIFELLGAGVSQAHLPLSVEPPPTT